MKAINPTSGQLIRDYAEHSPAEARDRLERAAAAFHAWRDLPLDQRAATLRAAARVLRARRGELAMLATDEMGKTLTAAEAEVDKCAGCCDWFADHAARLLAPRVVATDASKSYIRSDPLGVVLAVMPWNFPFWQVFRCAVPALVAGNTVALKHASGVPGCSLAIECVFREAGLPAGVFTTLLVPASGVGALIEHEAVRAVSLTGSEAAGVEVAARAGAALKKTVLELGGSDAFIVLADAQPVETAAAAAAARVINNGESCIAAKRFIVERPIAEAFERALAERMAALRVGDPRDRATDVGPLARADLVAALERQVEESIAAGARRLTGGERRPGPGFYFTPTVLVYVSPGMPVFDEETFGPVAAVTRARDADHALTLANHSRYGLGASVWTADARRGEALAARLEAGSVFVNGAVRSDPRLPFGGVKRSGYGRELSEEGLREFVNLKTVWVR
jgi:succinate-semialdehyde dehydrogenase/glutarate-semialdehyde dehydrogenase